MSFDDNNFSTGNVLIITNIIIFFYYFFKQSTPLLNKNQNYDQTIKDNYNLIKKYEKEIKPIYESTKLDDNDTNFMQKYYQIRNHCSKVSSAVKETDEILNEYNSGNLKLQKENVEKISKYISEMKMTLIPQIEEMSQRASKMSIDYNENAPNEENNEDNSAKAMFAQQIEDRSEYLKNRQNQLEDIHQNAKKIKEMTDQMVVAVNEQGEQLDTIEAHVIKTNENAKDAKKEIVEAAKLQKSNNKKTCCLIFIVFVAIAATVAILFSVIYGLNQ